jgi:hypothetical protein
MECRLKAMRTTGCVSDTERFRLTRWTANGEDPIPEPGGFLEASNEVSDKKEEIRQESDVYRKNGVSASSLIPLNKMSILHNNYSCFNLHRHGTVPVFGTVGNRQVLKAFWCSERSGLVNCKYIYNCCIIFSLKRTFLLRNVVSYDTPFRR